MPNPATTSQSPRRRPSSMANLLTKLYYMVPMNNAPLIAILGILSYNRVNNNPNFRSLTISIADPFVNSRRHWRAIRGLSLHDFVPLYWATHTPMQYVVTVKECKLVQEDLVFFILNAETVLGLPGVYTTD